MKIILSSYNIFQRVTTPSPEIGGIPQRRSARFISSILVVLIFFGTLSAVIQFIIVPSFQATFSGILLGVSLLVIAYFISRTKHYIYSAVITVIITTFAVVLNYLIDPTDSATLSFIFIGIFVASMFFSIRGIIAVILLDLVILSFILSLSDQIKLSDILAYQIYIIIFSGLMLISILQRDRLEEDRISDLRNNYDATLEGWANALELIDKETLGHSRRVLEMTTKLAIKIGIEGKELEDICRGALLHDIGKMAIPEEIMFKREPLTDNEWEILHSHPKIAYDLLSPIPFLHSALHIPFSHHEKWDGTGYPQGLIGKKIPLAARIFSIVDVWDALQSDRPYRAAWQEKKILEYLREQSGKHFDPKVVETFLELIDKSSDHATQASRVFVG